MSEFYNDSDRTRERRFYSVDDFETIRELGKGGYSVVYLVRHKETGKKYALKCAMKFKDNKDRSKRLRQEIEVLKDLRHRGTIRLRGWFEDEDNIYMVLQYISGGDLHKFFKKQLPSRDVVADIIHQIVRSLHYCHRKGIIHRDIKLDNILIDSKMRIRITDFGLCAIKDNDTEHFFEKVGTTRYTAPEMLNGKGYDESVDVWAIGIIFFLLLTGEYPFDDSERKYIFRRIKKEHINYTYYNLSKDEIHLLKRLLCKDPRYRIKLDDIVQHSWFEKYLN